MKFDTLGTNIGNFNTLIDNYRFLSIFGYEPKHVQVTIKNLPDLSVLHRIRNEIPDVQITIHAPFWINLCKNKEDTDSSVRYLNTLCRIAHAVKGYGVVTHVGWRGSKSSGESVSPEEAISNIIRCCEELSPNYSSRNIRLLIENTAGSRSGFPCGSVADIHSVVSLDLPGIYSCLDTCHCFSNSEDIRESYQLLEPTLGLVHLNPNNEKCSWGSHKDIHSKDKIRESFHTDPIIHKSIYESSTCPVILERSDVECILDDVNYLEPEYEPTNGPFEALRGDPRSLYNKS